VVSSLSNELWRLKDRDAQPGPWSGPLSRELLVFNSFLRALSRSLRGLVESVALNLLLRSDARRTREDYLELALSLPFHSDTNTGMGILFKAFGDAVCHLAGGVDVMKRAGAGTKGGSGEEEAAVKEAKVQTLGLLDEAFPNVKNVTAELQRGLRFWHLVRFLPSFLPSSAAVLKRCFPLFFLFFLLFRLLVGGHEIVGTNRFNGDDRLFWRYEL
jgi:hypothetical protein